MKIDDLLRADFHLAIHLNTPIIWLDLPTDPLPEPLGLVGCRCIGNTFACRAGSRNRLQLWKNSKLASWQMHLSMCMHIYWMYNQDSVLLCALSFVLHDFLQNPSMLWDSTSPCLIIEYVFIKYQYTYARRIICHTYSSIEHFFHYWASHHARQALDSPSCAKVTSHWIGSTMPKGCHGPS